LLGAQSANALIAIIYEKCLKISAATNKNFTNGEILTFVQVDALNLQELAQSLPTIAAMPMTLLICFIFLFKYLGLTFFCGIMIFILSIICNIWLSKLLAK
jgi:ABC-type transport system involved in cytochrome bd biosynthesis fused ATPase/permease subunit